MERYYLDKMNSRKETGKILGIMPIPAGTPFNFILANIFLCLFVEIFIGTYFISFFIGIILSYDMYIKNKLRIELLEYCILEEIFMKEDLKENGTGEFKYDSDTVTDEDRNSIFLDSLWIIKSKNKNPNKIGLVLSTILRRN